MFDIEQTYQVLQQHFHNRVLRSEPLSKHCSFAVGGPADLWVTLETQQELESLIRFCTIEQWPLLLVGAGRNVLFSDAGVRGVVARLDFQHFTVDREPDGTATVTAEAGVRWQSLLRHLLPEGWSGLEFGIGIPGTLGAGLISNAGAHNQDLGQCLEWIEILDARSCNTGTHDVFVPLIKRRYNANELDLNYRHSRFRINRTTHLDEQSLLVFPERHLIEPAEIVTQLGLRLHHLDPEELTARSSQYLHERQNHEPALPQTGPVFKDYGEQSAHTFIEQAGLAGKIIGKAQINTKDANYIVNLGGATAADIAALIKEAHRAVLAHSKVSLALNIDLLGDWSEHA